ncbi:MAG TPA: pyrroloquinoline quinone biosynthesis peptide chaperone PqqD [Thiotrichaceae bacterium]|nr:pyrroloquinoline quinone biosynthesis peptide chaperone PqqD [Thiotrichaceae bacterium]
MNKTDIIEVAPTFRVQWEEVQDCFVVLYPEGMVKLSQSAGEIMKRIDGQTTIESIIKDLETTFSENNLENDVLKFLEVAYDTGWIRNKK